MDSDTATAIRSLIPSADHYTSEQFETLLSIVERLRLQKRARRCPLKKIPDPDHLWRKLIKGVAQVTHYDYENDVHWEYNKGKLKKFLKEGHVSAVITTNYDLIADEALQDPGSENLPQFQYGFPIRGLLKAKDDENDQKKCVPWHFDKYKIPIYKIHGSMNWAYCAYCKELDLSATRKVIWKVYDPSDPPRCEKCNSPYGPVIIPPVPNKGVFDNPVLGQVWQKAENVLETADLVIFVGYGLPQADPLVVQMLTTARHRSAQVRGGRGWGFCVIDPSCCTHTRYKTLFGSEGRHYVSGFDVALLWDSRQSGGLPFGQSQQA